MADFNKSKNNFFGTYIINDSNKATINCTSIIVRTDATFTSLKVAGQAADVRERYISEKTGAIPAGTELVCKDGYFSEITLEKGIVEVVLMQRDPKPIAVPELPDPNAGFRITSCPGVVPGGEYTVLTSGFAEEVGITLVAGMSLTFSGVEPFPNGCYYVTETDLGGEALEVEGGVVAVVEDGPCLDCVENANSFVLFPCEGEEGEIFYADSAVGVDLNTYVGASLRIGETCYRVEKSLLGGPALEAPFGDPCECGEEPPAPECPGEIDSCGNCTSDEGYLAPDDCDNCPGDEEYPCEPPSEGFTLLIEGVEGSQVGNPDFEGAGVELPPPFGAGPEGSQWVAIQISEEAPEGLAWDLVCGQPEFGLPLSEPVGNTPWMIHNEAGAAYMPSFSFNGIGDLQPGEVYQISITQNRTLNPAAIEGLEGHISFYTGEAELVITAGMFEAPDETESNMTVGINAGEALNTAYQGGQLGAFYDLNNDGNLQCVGLSSIVEGFFGLAVWGNNPETAEKDGLDAGNVPIFAILYEGAVYLFEPSPAFSGYETNGIVIIADGEASPLTPAEEEGPA